MTNETRQPLDSRRLEAWLRQLESALQDVSVIDRSDIVMELNAHIRESFDRGDRTLDEILTALGEPVQVANRYRLERGMQPVVIPRSQTPAGAFFKWATIGVLGFFAILFVGGAFFVSRFFPLVQVDEKAGQVRLLGGMIDVKDDDLHLDWDESRDGVSVRLGGDEVGGAGAKLEGRIEESVTSVRVKAANGKMNVRRAKNSKLGYDCRLRGSASSAAAERIIRRPSAGAVELDFSETAGLVGCELEIPERAQLALTVDNGDIDLSRLRNPLDVALTNGRITFEPDSGANYELKTEVTNGLVIGLTDFEKEQRERGAKDPKNTFAADLRVTNGGIRVR